MQTDVSVIVPTCGRPELLTRAVESAMAQTLLPAEIVIVDVGGNSWSDGLGQIVAHAPLPVRHVVRQPPTFAGRARNIGASLALHPVLAFLDDDDVWMPDYLSQARGLLRPGAAVATPVVIRRGDAALPPQPIPAGLRADDVIARNPGVTGTNLLLHRDSWELLGGYDEQLSSFNDLDLLVRMLDAGIELVVAPRSLAVQFIHERGQLTTPSVARLNALGLYLAKHRHRMSRKQQRLMDRERHWMLAHVASTRVSRTWHRAAELCSTAPRDLVHQTRRRLTLRGGYG